MPLITSRPPSPDTHPWGANARSTPVLCVFVRVCESIRVCVYLHSWQSCGGKQGTDLLPCALPVVYYCSAYTCLG